MLGETSGGTEGLFKIDTSGTIELVASEGGIAPGSGGATLFAILEADLNSAGVIAYSASLDFGSSQFSTAIYRIDAMGSQTTLAVGNPTGVQPTSHVFVTAAGEVVYPVGQVDPMSMFGLVLAEEYLSFSGAGPATQRVALADPIPGTGLTITSLDSEGPQFIQLRDRKITAAGDLVLSTTLSSGSDAMVIEEANGDLSIRLTDGDALPPPASGTITSFSGPNMNAALDVAVILNFSKLALYRAGEPAEVLVESGDSIAGFPGIQFVGFGASITARKFNLATAAIDDAGNIAFPGLTDSSAEGLFLVRAPASTPALPAPAWAACAALITLAAALRTRGVRS